MALMIKIANPWHKSRARRCALLSNRHNLIHNRRLHTSCIYIYRRKHCGHGEQDGYSCSCEVDGWRVQSDPFCSSCLLGISTGSGVCSGWNLGFFSGSGCCSGLNLRFCSGSGSYRCFLLGLSTGSTALGAPVIAAANFRNNESCRGDHHAIVKISATISAVGK